MSTAARLAVAGIARAPGRTALRVAVLALSVALLGGMLLFVGHSLREMSGSSVRSVPLDWQGPVTSHAQAARVAREVSRQPGVLQASAAATAPLARAEHRGPAGLSSAGDGAVLAVPSYYLRHIHTFRMLHGALRPVGVVLDQQMAATLQARVGDRVALRTSRTGAAQSFPVTGVALVTAPDPLFQPLDPRLGPAPAQPPANLAIMSTDTFAGTLARQSQALGPASPLSGDQPGARSGVQWQVQAQLDPGPLSQGSPSAALKRADQTRNRVERSLPGQVQFVDNLSDSLNTAAGDALYAQALYIMLAVPGALAALGLAYLAALGTADRDRRDLALLRARGASRRDVLALAGVESLLVGTLAGLLGTGLALAAVSLLISGGVGLTPARAAIAGAACVALGIAGAGTARLGASAEALRLEVAEGRRSSRRTGRPLWQRLYVDVIALAVSGLIYWLTARTGFSAVVNPDSNPTLSLSVYMFFAPALLWIGATLLVVRLRGRALAWVAARARARAGLGGRPSALAPFLLASAARRGPAINRGLVVVGLLLAFGVNLSLFTATYHHQAQIDAQLTLGADVTATAAPGVVARHGLERRIDAVPGVRATTALDHAYSYVGPDLQDTYGIDPTSFTRATTLRDSYFLGGTAKQMMDRLRARPDGVLVSQETITDYSLRPGDLLKLRVLDRRSGAFRVARFHVLGVVQEFPSAPKDSFMVANLGYLRAQTHAPGPNVVFAKVSGDPAAVARRVAAATRADGTKVDDIDHQTAKTVTSITTVDLTGISRIEEAFVVGLVAAAMLLFVALGIAERRHEFATMAALGARLRDAAAFLWSEAAAVLGAGLVFGALLGWLLAEMLVAMLRHVFDPPPDALTVPWAYLGGLGAAAVGATVLAIAVAMRGLRRLPLGETLREQ